MKKTRKTLKAKPKKPRRTWDINPVSRVHSNKKYKRSEKKKEDKKVIEESG